MGARASIFIFVSGPCAVRCVFVSALFHATPSLMPVLNKVQHVDQYIPDTARHDSSIVSEPLDASCSGQLPLNRRRL